MINYRFVFGLVFLPNETSDGSEKERLEITKLSLGPSLDG